MSQNPNGISSRFSSQLSSPINFYSIATQGNALANVFGQLGMFFSPYIVYSVVFHEALPFLILTVGSFAGAAVSAFLPETAGVQGPIV